MSDLAEAIMAILIDEQDLNLGDPDDRRYIAEQIIALFTAETYRVPEYDVEPVIEGRGDISYGGQLMHYKGLKTVQRWTYTDG